MHLRFGLAYSDRSVPLIDRSVPSKHFDYSVIVDRPGILFLNMLEKRIFDVCEMSLATYVIRRSRGFDDLVALPVFLSRGFPHHTLYALREAGGGKLDWEVRAIGVPEYQMTAAVWARAILEDELSLPLQNVRWRTGGLEGGLRRERLPLPHGLSAIVENDASGVGLVQSLVDGNVDLLISPTVPAMFRSGDTAVKRLFPDFADREIAFYRRTKVFPILHTLVIRRELQEAEPWLAPELFALFVGGKEWALRRLRETDTYAASLAWLPGAVDFHESVLGDQLWPYGMAENRHVLDAFIAACDRQQLLSQRQSPDELFLGVG